MKKKWTKVVAGLAVSTVLAAGCGGGRQETTTGGGGASGGQAASPGITDTEIKLGSSFPFSGPASSYGTIANAEKAYFKYVNDELGGVKSADGKTRKINYNVLDDGYEPQRAVQNVRRLAEQEQVFALFQTLGTANNAAIIDYANQQKLPHLFISSGASAWGADPEKHPWSVGFNSAYATEAAIYAEYLKQEKPNAKVAVLYQNDDFGKDYLNPFKEAIKGSGITVIAEESYQVADPTVDSQVVKLSNTGADVFLDITTPKFAAQAIKKLSETPWKPLHILSQVSASPETVFKPAGPPNAVGIVSANYFKDPIDPQLASDPAIVKYKEVLAKHGPGLAAVNPNNAYGFAAAQTMVAALEKMATPTRQGLVDAVRSMDTEIPMLLPGIKVKLGPGDAYPIESMQLLRFNGTLMQPVGEVISYEGKTPKAPEA